MQIEPTRDYHMRRARSEIDLAYRAESRAVMEAHLKLSALHMARLRVATKSPYRGAATPVPALEEVRSAAFA